MPAPSTATTTTRQSRRNKAETRRQAAGHNVKTGRGFAETVQDFGGVLGRVFRRLVGFPGGDDELAAEAGGGEHAGVPFGVPSRRHRGDRLAQDPPVDAAGESPDDCQFVNGFACRP